MDNNNMKDWEKELLASTHRFVSRTLPDLSNARHNNIAANIYAAMHSTMERAIKAREQTALMIANKGKEDKDAEV
jgi:hypothetical protein